MRLEIAHGEIILSNHADDTRITIHPRRSLTVGCTQARLETAALSAYDITVEAEAESRSARPWLWRGDAPSALHLADLVLAALHRHFSQDGADRAWSDRFLTQFPLAATRAKNRAAKTLTAAPG